jgi:hypothetical protein
MVLIGLEVHRDAATHANASRRKANCLLILFIQQVVDLYLQTQAPDTPDVLEHRIGTRQVDKREPGSVTRGEPG